MLDGRIAGPQLSPRGVPVLRGRALDPDLAFALREIARLAPRDAVLVPPAEVDGPRLALVALLAERSLLGPHTATSGEAARRADLITRLPSAEAAALLQLRGTPGLQGRELWAVHGGSGWPGFITLLHRAGQLVERAPVPNLLLVTVSALPAGALDDGSLPRIATRFAQGVLFEQLISPLPDELPGLSTLLTGLAPPEHGVRGSDDGYAGATLTLASATARFGYRSAAVVALDADAGLLDTFDRGERLPHADAETLVDRALAQLGSADPRPLLLWLHLPQTPAAALDPAIARLLASVSEHDLLLLTAPRGATAHATPDGVPGALAETCVHVPLAVSGAGMPSGRWPRLAALQDVAALLLAGRLPERDHVLLEAPARGEGERAWGLRSAHTKTILLRASEGERAPEGVRFELLTDPEEVAPLPPDPALLREIAARRRLLLD
jgi:hypothetical protein